MYAEREQNKIRMRHQLFSCVAQVPAGEGFMVGFDAGTAVPSDGPGLDGGQACGRGGCGPRGRDPPQKTRVEAPPQTLHTHNE